MGVGGTLAPSSLKTASPVTPQTTLLGAIAPAVKTHASSVIQRPDAVNPNQTGAAAQATQASSALAGQSQDLARTRAAVVDAIKQAKAEIMAATKGAGYDPNAVYPDTRIAPETGVELLGAAYSGIKGRGSMVTALEVGNSLSTAATVGAQMKGRPPKEVEDAIRTALIQSSTPGNGQGFGLVQDGRAPDALAPSKIDWAGVLGQHPDALHQIAYFDENSYDPKAFPELAALDSAAGITNRWQGEMNAAKEKAVDAPTTTVATDLIASYAAAAGGVEALKDNIEAGGYMVASMSVKGSLVEAAYKAVGKPGSALYIPPPQFAVSGPVASAMAPA
jgi:hypothetical protein